MSEIILFSTSLEAEIPVVGKTRTQHTSEETTTKKPQKQNTSNKVSTILEKEIQTHKSKREKGKESQSDSKVSISCETNTHCMEETPDIEASEIKVIKKPEKESSQTKVSACSEEDTHSIGETGICAWAGKKPKISENKRMLSKLSVTMQPSWSSEQPPIQSKPVEDQFTELKSEIHRLQGEVFKYREKHYEDQNYYTEKVSYLEDMNRKLFYQIQWLVSRVNELEGLDYSRSNITL